jgi:hypothetical protein
VATRPDDDPAGGPLRWRSRKGVLTADEDDERGWKRIGTVCGELTRLGVD